MRQAWLCGALLGALIGCGSSSGGGTGGANGGAGANGTGGAAGTSGSAGTTGIAGAGGAGAAGQAGTGGTAGANGGAGGAGATPLAAGTYAGTASTADCVGFPGAPACPLQITISGSGPAYQVTGFMLPGGITGTGVSITQTGGDLDVNLLTGSTVDFCPATEYTGNGSVGSGGASMMVTLTGPPCSSSDTVFISALLTKQ